MRPIEIDLINLTGLAALCVPIIIISPQEKFDSAGQAGRATHINIVKTILLPIDLKSLNHNKVFIETIVLSGSIVGY